MEQGLAAYRATSAELWLLIWRRRGEHLAGAGGIKHAIADEAGVQGLVTGAAAGDQRHLVVHRRAGAGDEGREIGMRRGKAVETLGQDALNGASSASSFVRRALLERVVLHHLESPNASRSYLMDGRDQTIATEDCSSQCASSAEAGARAWSLMAGAFGGRGSGCDALALLDEALARVNGTGERWFEANLRPEADEDPPA
jgi:hypothetical protein